MNDTEPNASLFIFLTSLASDDSHRRKILHCRATIRITGSDDPAEKALATLAVRTANKIAEHQSLLLVFVVAAKSDPSAAYRYPLNLDGSKLH